MIRAVSVQANSDFSIDVTLEDGSILKMDMSFIKAQNGPVVDPIKDLREFKGVFIRDGIVTWNTGYDIDPYYLVEVGVRVKNDAAS